MHRRNFLSSSLALGSALPLARSLLAEPQGKTEKADLVIDAHGHAGHGEALSAPWSTFNDPEVILRHAEEQGSTRPSSSRSRIRPTRRRTRR